MPYSSAFFFVVERENEYGKKTKYYRRIFQVSSQVMLGLLQGDENTRPQADW